MSSFYKSHLTPRKREFLVVGYVRINCKNVFIPLDIIRLFLMMFGDNTIYWRIQGDEYKSLLNNQSPQWKMQSSSLKIHDIEFKLQIEKKLARPNRTNIILSVTSSESDDQYVITRYTFYCEETKYQYRKFTDNRTGEAVEWTEDFMSVSEIKQMGLKSINFVCKIEILHVYQKYDYNASIENEMIEAYYSNIIMTNKYDYKWLIYNDNIETKTHSLFEMTDIDDKKENFKSYYSPYFDHNNWCLLFTESKTRFGVQLQLLSLPFGIVSIVAKWQCCIFYKGEYKDKYEEIFEFGFESDAVLSHGWNKKDIIDNFWTEWDKDDETKAAMKDAMDIQYVEEIMLESKIEILMAKEYNENIVFRENWPLYGIHIIDDIDIKDETHRDGHIALVSDFDDDNFSWNYMISAVRKQFDEKLKQQDMKYEHELNLLRNEIKQLKETTVTVKYEIDKESAEEVNVWLYSIGMSMYYDTFIQNGFDSINMVKQINDKQDLIDIGIKLKAHQLSIMNGIVKLKQ